MNIKNTIFFNGRYCSVMNYGILWPNISILDRCFYHVYSVTSHNNPGVYMIASCGLIHLLFFQHTSSIAVISFHSAISIFKKRNGLSTIKLVTYLSQLHLVRIRLQSLMHQQFPWSFRFFLLFLLPPLGLMILFYRYFDHLYP